MAEMAGQGKFFDCAPYGTCWQPNDESDDDQDAAEQSFNPGDRQSLARSGQEAHLELAGYHPAWGQTDQNTQTQNAQSSRPRPADSAGSAVPPELGRSGLQFPCTPESLVFRMVKDPATGKLVRVATTLTQHNDYDWAVCHAGTWIRHHKHYAWVAAASGTTSARCAG